MKLLDILLVSDDRAACALFGQAVDKSGLNICLQTVTDGEQAIDYLEGRGDYVDRLVQPVPDMVVLNLDTRLAGSLFFLSWRRHSALCSTLPVVFLRAFTFKGALATALARETDTLITTPLELGGWKAVVRQIWNLATELRKAIA
jgi:CheY-like chemotaxis protein